MVPNLTEYEIELVAAALHASWYAYAVLAKGEPGEPWERAPEWQKASCRDAARFHFDLYRRGVPASEWPESQRAKDDVAVQASIAMFVALGR